MSKKKESDEFWAKKLLEMGATEGPRTALPFNGVEPLRIPESVPDPGDAEELDKPKPKEMVPSVFAPPGTWVVPVVTKAEVNQGGSRGGWRTARQRTINAHNRISKALGAKLEYLAPFGVHYHKGGALRITITRLGGQRLDRVNLGSALKAAEDAVAKHLGADDGDERWHLVTDQRPGGLIGIRIVLEIIERSPA